MSNQKRFAIDGDVLVTFHNPKNGNEISEEKAQEIAESKQYDIDLEKKLVFDISNNMEVVCVIEVNYEIHGLELEKDIPM